MVADRSEGYDRIELLGVLVFDNKIRKGQLLCAACGFRECVMDRDKFRDYGNDYGDSLEKQYSDCITIPA